VIHTGVARRYARALLSLGLEEGRHEQLGDELASVLRTMQDNPELGFLLQNQGYSQEQRKGAVEALSQVLKLSPLLVNFLRFLVERQRTADLHAIGRAYSSLLDTQVGRIRATVTAAEPLAPEDVKKLREALSSMTGRSVVLEAKTDPKILGGVVTQVGATQYDGSLKTQLEKLRSELKQAPG
jgi:F-type H+-transporting ATPase subunit delta